MHDAVVQHVAHRVARQDMSARVHHWDVGGQSGYNARMASSTGYAPNAGLDEKWNTFYVDCGLR